MFHVNGFVIRNQKSFTAFTKKNIDSNTAFEINSPSNRQFKKSTKKISPWNWYTNMMKGTSKDDVIYQNLKPIILMLHIYGILPLSRTKHGRSYFDPFSISSIYSVILFFAVLLFVYVYSPQNVQISRAAGDGKFEQFVIEYVFTVLMLPLLFVLVMWYEASKISVLLNTWMEFEISYKKILNKSLRLKTAKRSLLLAIFTAILPIVTVVIHQTMMNYHSLTGLLYIYLESVVLTPGCYWYCLCDILAETANILADDFQLVIRNIGPSKRIANIRTLWLHLSKLVQLTGSANCYTFCSICVYLFTISTLSIYGALSQISEGISIKDVSLSLAATTSIGLFFFICNHAHYASQNLQSTMVTYLVVLLQFQMSIPGEEKSEFTETNVTLNNTKV